ncbi:flagellar biosynthetic protein FliR [Photobacterium sp. GJ3]|uniref:flagellar biosynthetic protein FliR n=1 Tax=Photobacterium sp. GJ3 TaxID=2829502 RepID=UPI001B8AA14A|nr:flagellar biosynthetic protein FliR [Photobacterium sp. GJ3]QUJ68506.1 flagellar biosynthetic protein FliR [Photobacterium sp. GJ3]
MTVNAVLIDWQSYTVVFFLIILRITPALVFRSINPLSMLPPFIKLVVTVVIGVMISLHTIDDNLIQRAVQLEGTALAVACLNEFFIGLVFWFALVVTYGAIFTFLKLLDMQVGFNPMGIFNPAMQESEPILTRAIIIFISLMFFVSNAHYTVIELLAASLTHYPVLSGPGEPQLEMMIALFSSQMILAFLLALPVMIAIFWVDLILGLCNKVMPQINIYFVGLPAKTAVAFLVLGISARHVSEMTDRLFDGVFSYWLSLY